MYGYWTFSITVDEVSYDSNGTTYVPTYTTGTNTDGRKLTRKNETLGIKTKLPEIY